MKRPEEVLATARGRAAQRRAREQSVTASGSEEPTSSTRRLVEWAIIEPEEARVYSTRRFGGAITALKRLLVRFMRQYLNEVAAQQSRFNSNVAAHVIRLEERVRALEESADGRAPVERRDPPPDGSTR